jgi:hypothetical protein
LDGIKPLVELIDDLSDEIKCLAAETISYCCQNRMHSQSKVLMVAMNRKLVRRYGGIKKLVRLLKSKNEDVARSGALALCTCSKSSKASMKISLLFRQK